MTLAALLAALAVAAGVAVALPPRGRAGRALATAAGAAGVALLVTEVAGRRAWEAGARRAAYVAAHAHGVALDRGVDWSLAGACLAVAAAVAAWADRDAPPWMLRTALGGAAVLALAGAGATRSGW